MAQLEMIIDSLRQNSRSVEWAIILREKGRERYLPIYVGPSHADIVRRELISPRPEYCDLRLESIGVAAGIDMRFARLESVVIKRFEDNVFHAKLLVTYRNIRHEVDCPLPKAVAIGVRAKAPIYVDEVVLDKAGINVHV